MRFTEHELTVAITAAAKQVATAGNRRVRSGKVEADEVWDTMDRYARYQALDAVGGQILAALVALPDVEVAAGTRPAFTDGQLVVAVEETLGEVGGRIRRKVVVAARTALMRTAIAALPARLDPDALS